MDILPAYRHSFFCGRQRENGLKLQVMYEKDMVYCDVFVDKKFEGYVDVVHGGIVMGILDTMMWYAILMATKKVCMTRHIDMDFLKPIYCNSPYTAKSQFVRIKGRDVYASGWMEDEKGEVCMRLNGVFREAKDLTISDVVTRLDFSYASPGMKELFLAFAEETRGEREGYRPGQQNSGLRAQGSGVSNSE
jgi:acyl-coenzyme A thioesterase PaaI-like protein